MAMTAAAAHVGRIGGLVVALGVGIGVAIGGAGVAWASPADSSTSSSVGADAASPRSDGRGHKSLSPRRSSALKPAGAGTNRSTPAPAQGDVPQPASAPTRNNLIVAAVEPMATPRPKAPASPAAVLVAALAQAVRRDTEQTLRTETAAAQLTADPVQSPNSLADSKTRPRATLPLVASTKRGTLITIFKNTHFSLPRQTRFFIKHVSGDATFTDNSIYDLNNVDQFDWNKLTGISFTPWRPDTDAIMVAWRYNVQSKMFEIGPYYNVATARIMPSEAEIISVPVGQKFDFAVDYHGITLTYGSSTVYKPAPEDLNTNCWTAFRISSWFGGTSVAPKKISFYLDLH